VLYFSIFLASTYFIRRRRRDEHGRSTVWTLLPSAVLIVISPFTARLLDDVLRLTPYLFTKIDPILWSFFYGALTIFTWRLGGLLADWLIHYERLQKSSLDEQIIRLVVRLITIFLSMAVLVSGANRLGVPVYSVMAGLGIGGLAAALAGQQTLANLFGSLIIMLEKPFRVGHMIRAGGFEGTVDEVGFRSARIITRDNTPLTVPCSTLVNHNIENLTLRQYWHVKHVLHFVVSTPVEDIHGYVDTVKAWVEGRDDVRKDRIKICLMGLGLHGYEILVDFSVRARGEIEFFYKQDKILFKLAEMAKEQGITFEHPVY
jgi:MscS family membrane protein